MASFGWGGDFEKEKSPFCRFSLTFAKEDL